MEVDKELYLLLGEIKVTQDHLTKTMEEVNKRVTKMESKINYAIGIVTTIVFFFQAGWTYITKMGKA